MAYPGNPDLSAEAKEKVITTFRRVVRLLQEGKREEAQIGLEFCLRLDPSFGPGVSLQEQFTSGEHELDLSSVLSSLAAPTTEEVNLLLVDAVDEFNNRRYFDAREKVEKVLKDLPGHQEGRELLRQIQDAIKVESQVAHFLSQARETFDGGDPQEAANFVMMAQALDPHHPGISAMLAELNAAGGGEGPEAGADFSFGAGDEAGDGPLFDDGASTRAIDLSEIGSPEAEAPTFEFSAEALQSEPGGFGEDATAATVADTDRAADLASADSRARGDGAPSFDFAEPAEAGTFDFEPPGGDDWDLGSHAGGPAVDGPGAFETVGETDSESSLFDLDGAAEVAADEGLDGVGAEEAEKMRQLLAQGELAYESGRYQDAIDAWSRVYLIDPSSSRAGERIERARERQAEVERTIEHLLYEARSAADAGREEEAVRIVDEILDLQPNQLDAVELRDQIRGPGADEPGREVESIAADGDAVSAVPSLPDLDDDLFREGGLDEALEASVGPAPSERKIAHVEAPKARSMPIRTIAGVAAAMVVVALGVWFGSQLISGGDGDGGQAVVEEALAQARQLRAEGRIEDAIALLQNVQVSGLDQTVIRNEIEAYQKAMTPPTPTPVPQDLVAARELFDSGSWLEAYRRVQQGLRDHPRDGELNQLKEQILEMEPALGSLYRAEEAGDSAGALAAARELVASNPDHPAYQASLDRHLFNTAIENVKEHNLAGGTALLTELLERQPSDEEATQILSFIETYKRRPADMQLRVFTKSLSKR